MLINNWTGKGFQHLSTAPQDSVSAPLTSIYTKSAHAGTVWDSRRNIMWTFGAETHNISMDNAVYGWRASDGLFVKHYDGDPKSGYMMDANGVYWSSAAKDKPWGMHTYRRMRMVPGTDEFEVLYDPFEHAGMLPQVYENPAMSGKDDRKPVIWYYNVVTGKWRYESFGQAASFINAYYAYPVGYDDTYGWFGGDGSFWTSLSKNGNYSRLSVSGKSNNQYHSFMHVKDGVAYKVGGNENFTLYSKHPLANIALSTKHTVASFPALNGYDVTNMASAMMSNGKIVIFPARGSEMHAMILDPVANTVTATGHFITGMDKAGLYDLAAEWDDAHGAVILMSRRFTGTKVFGYRP